VISVIRALFIRWPRKERYSHGLGSRCGAHFAYVSEQLLGKYLFDVSGV
jgi:hypothetical protein